MTSADNMAQRGRLVQDDYTDCPPDCIRKIKSPVPFRPPTPVIIAPSRVAIQFVSNLRPSTLTAVIGCSLENALNVSFQAVVHGLTLGYVVQSRTASSVRGGRGGGGTIVLQHARKRCVPILHFVFLCRTVYVIPKL